MTRKFTIAFLSVVLAVGVLVIVDRAVGNFIDLQLIFPPHIRVMYRTPEFTFEVASNNLGFRDRTFKRTKRGFRIVAIGDSFTYGWGVKAEESWPKVLEGNLRRKTRDIEVANLGCPGAGPPTYVKIVEKVIPVLKPDLVIIGVVQGDDFAQCNVTFGPDQHPLGASHVAELLFPNLLSFFRTKSVGTGPVDLSSKWRGQANALVSSFNTVGRKRFDKIEPSLRNEFLQGRINPWVIRLAVEDPDYFLHTMDLSQNRQDFQNMAQEFRRIKTIADRFQIPALVISVPNGVYVSEQDLKSRQALGFHVGQNLLSSDLPDQVIANAAQQANLPFFKVTDQFRQAGNKTILYFPIDGHLNSSGQKLLGDLLTGFIQSKVGALR